MATYFLWSVYILRIVNFLYPTSKKLWALGNEDFGVSTESSFAKAHNFWDVGYTKTQFSGFSKGILDQKKNKWPFVYRH